MNLLQEVRDTKTYLAGAKMASHSSKCLKMQVGSVLVSKDNKIISYGWNDATPKEPYCPREKLTSGTCYFLCSTHCAQKHHSETMAIHKAKLGTDLTDSTMYIYGHSLICEDCKEAMMYHGIKTVILKKDDESKTVKCILRK